VVLVPGFCGYARGGPTKTPRAVDLWLGFVTGESEVSSWQIATPKEGILCREPPPDADLEAFVSVLLDHAAERMALFAYDWRHDLTASAARLGAELEEHAKLLDVREIDLVGIGPGGLVVRYLLESGALPEASRLVRRSVLIASPDRGIPAALPILHSWLRMEGAGLAQLLSTFPALVQLLPPRGVVYAYLDGQPSLRVEPFGWPEALLGGAEAGAEGGAVVAEAAALNDALHGAIAEVFHASWRSQLAIASVSEPTVCQIDLPTVAGRPERSDGQARPTSGDGVVPAFSGLARPGARQFLVEGAHAHLPSTRDVASLVPAFLTGPLA